MPLPSSLLLHYLGLERNRAWRIRDWRGRFLAEVFLWSIVGICGFNQRHFCICHSFRSSVVRTPNPCCRTIGYTLSQVVPIVLEFLVIEVVL